MLEIIGFEAKNIYLVGSKVALIVKALAPSGMFPAGEANIHYTSEGFYVVRGEERTDLKSRPGEYIITVDSERHLNVLIYLDSDGIRFGYLLPDTTCTDRVMSASTKEIE